MSKACLAFMNVDPKLFVVTLVLKQGVSDIEKRHTNYHD